MKTALRIGGPADLNIYVNKADRFLGWATMPPVCRTNGPNKDGVNTYDGVVLKDSTGPGNGPFYGEGGKLSIKAAFVLE